MKNALTIRSFTWKRVLFFTAILLTLLCVVLAGLDYRQFRKGVWLARLKAGSPQAKIIANTLSFLEKEYPWRHFLSEGSIGKVKFLEPQALKEGTETAIIVLGDRPLDDTTPTVDMVYRVLKGVELTKKFPKAVMIMSGGLTKGPTSEAQMMGLIAWSRGVDPLRIILEDKSQTTSENAEYTAKIVGPKNVGQVFVVAEPSRVDDAVAIFQKHNKEFKNIQGVASDVSQDLIIRQMEEFLRSHDDRIVRGRLHYVIRGMKSKAFDFAVFPEE